jgi:hypothetical protein
VRAQVKTRGHKYPEIWGSGISALFKLTNPASKLEIQTKLQLKLCSDTSIKPHLWHLIQTLMRAHGQQLLCNTAAIPATGSTKKLVVA